MADDIRALSVAALPAPSSKLLRAALAGLLAMTVSACADDGKSDKITSTQRVGYMDAEDFQAMCDARHGTVEAIAHCGGVASGPGFAYDQTTQELSEHTCKGGNTCAGWNCITDE